MALQWVFLSGQKMLNYDYAPAKKYADELGLVWLGDDYIPLVEMDREAKKQGLTQQQVTIGLYQHLRQIKILFNPKSYKYFQRLAIAFYFITGWKPK